jgi:hypothetical protein
MPLSFDIVSFDMPLSFDIVSFDAVDLVDFFLPFFFVALWAGAVFVSDFIVSVVADGGVAGAGAGAGVCAEALSATAKALASSADINLVIMESSKRLISSGQKRHFFVVSGALTPQRPAG